jgi:PAS domain S-box-containing protein
MLNFGTLLVAYRREKGISQEELAALLEVDTTTLGRWERGKARPRVAAEARIRSIIKPRAGIDWQLRQIIDTTPVLMELMLPSTRVLMASPAIERIAGQTQSELVGLYDIFDMSQRMIADHEKHGGIENVLRDCKASSGSHIWGASKPTNKSGKDLHLFDMTQRVILDDGTVACLTTMTIQPDDTPYKPFKIVP